MLNKSKKPRLIEVRFICGPLDGLTQFFFEDDLKPEIAIPISSKLFRQLEGINDAAQPRPTSVAVYKAQFGEPGHKYMFGGAESAKYVSCKS